MNIATKAIISFFSLALTTANVYADNPPSHYLFQYESGNTYDVTFTDNTITWKGIEGEDKGQTGTDYIKKKNILDKVEVIQWSEKSGTFVTLIFDRAHLNIISSIRSADGDWLQSGKATLVNN